MTANRWVRVAAAAVAVMAGACGSPTGSVNASDPALARVEAIQAAVTAWRDAGSLAQAKAAAETARNLVTGPHVSGYGDLDGDGTTLGSSTIGLLPDERGQEGLVARPASTCADRDVLGGSWDDPAARWAELRDRITRWSPTNNTFPALPSHPQRVVGWATLAIGAGSLDTALEYAGHAQLHVDITRSALASCPK